MTDRVVRLLSGLMAICAAAVLLLIMAEMARAAWPALTRVPVSEWLLSAHWSPSGGDFGLASMLAASLLTSAGALLIAGPAGVVLGAWMHLAAPGWLRGGLRTLQGLMAGIPSVVYGLWGLITLVPLVNTVAPPGAVMLTAILVLALMILPLSVLVTDAALSQIPDQALQSARALALSRWGSFRSVLWPRARAAIVSGIVLQFGRALGETMAVLMVAGNVIRWPDSLTAPVRTITANIALEMGYASGLHLEVLYLSGLLLLVAVALMMGLIQRGAGNL